LVVELTPTFIQEFQKMLLMIKCMTAEKTLQFNIRLLKLSHKISLPDTFYNL